MQKCLYCTSNNSPPSRKRCHTFLRECPSARACSISGSARRINPVFVVGASVRRALIGAMASCQLSFTVTIPPFSPQKTTKSYMTDVYHCVQPTINHKRHRKVNAKSYKDRKSVV